MYNGALTALRTSEKNLNMIYNPLTVSLLSAQILQSLKQEKQQLCHCISF